MRCADNRKRRRASGAGASCPRSCPRVPCRMRPRRAKAHLGAADANLLVEEEAVGVEVRIAQGASVPLDDLDLVQVGRAAQLEHGVDGNLREELLVLRQDLRNDRTPQE
eukprot:859720-Prymnesium_polylepis.1